MNRLFYVFSLVFLVYSCTQKPANSATGRNGEVLIVCDDALWNNDVKPLTDSLFTQFILPYIPDVATFEMVQRSQERLSPAMKKYRNIIQMNIDPNFSGDKAKILKRNDVWASGQVVFEITAKNKEQLLTTLSSSYASIHDEMEQSLLKRMIEEYNRADNASANKLLGSKFGINLSMPDRSKVVSNQDNFVRVEFPEASKRMDLKGSKPVSDAGRIFSGVMIYQWDYKDTSQLEIVKLCRVRDSILKINAPSEVQNMYMTTQYGKMTYPVGSKAKSEFNVSGTEIRGMYKFIGGGMVGTGGPFWDFYLVNEKTNKIVCISTYLDISPVTNWTDYIRSIEAVWRSTKLVN